MICGIAAGLSLNGSTFNRQPTNLPNVGHEKHPFYKRPAAKVLCTVSILAILIFQSAPTVSETYRRSAVSFVSQGNLINGLESIKRAIYYRPFSSVLFTDQAHIYRQMYKKTKDPAAYQNAIKSYGNAIKNNPFFAPYYLEYASMVLAKANRPSELELATTGRFLARGRELNPFYWEIHSNLGTVLFMQGKYEPAVEAYQMALRLYPESVEVHHNLGLAYQAVGNFEGAIAAFSNEIRYSPSDAGSYLRLAKAYLGMAKMTEATNEYQRALELEPMNPMVPKDFGQAALDSGYLEIAEKAYQHALVISPLDADVWTNLGATLFRQEFYGKAASCFVRVIEINPSDLNAYVNLGNCFAKQGKIADALEVYKKALVLDPENLRVQNYISTLKNVQIVN